MKRPKTYGNHQCCPSEWSNTPDLTGSHELDAMVMRTKNKDMQDRIESHLVSDIAYKRNSGYGRGSVS